MANFLAIDLGASSGRLLVGQWDGTAFNLEELHRFPNGPTHVFGHLYWDVLRLWDEVKYGLANYRTRFPDPPAAIAVDTWGVDFALLDRRGGLLGNPYHYRDQRTDGVPSRAFRKVPREQIFETTGIQFMQINTLFQLYSMVETNDPHLEAAETMLMMPDLFHYWLTGTQGVEYTIATTSQMFDAKRRAWADGLVRSLGIPTRILPEIRLPGSVIGPLRFEVAQETGLPETLPVVAAATHDTASAVAAIPGLDDSSAYISSGTWSLMGLETCSPVITQEALALNITNEGGAGGTIRLLKNIAGLWLLQESRRRWAREGYNFSWEELLELARNAPPLRSLVDPDAQDFMNPPDMPAAIRAYCRETGQPEPEEPGAVVRCCLESLALKYQYVLNRLEKLAGRQIRTLRVVGGGCQNRLLSQFTADACGRSVITGPVEATALGNIMLQAIATGHLENIRTGRQAIAASVEQERFEPGIGNWDEASRRYRDLLAR